MINTKGDVIAWNCNCKVGGLSYNENENEMNMLCVHICPSIMKIVMVLFAYLAEDICYELRSMWSNVDLYDIYNDNEINKIEKSVRVLATVAFSNKGQIFKEEIATKTLRDLFKSYFTVGTEWSKDRNTNFTYPLEHTPLSQLTEKSIFCVACNAMSGEEENKQVDKVILYPFIPKYKRIVQTIRALPGSYDLLMKYIWYKLLLYWSATSLNSYNDVELDINNNNKIAC